MEYQTVFDISTAGYKSGFFVIFGLVFVGIAFWLLVFKRNYTYSRNTKFFKIFII